jgi:hypothetical protein
MKPAQQERDISPASLEAFAEAISVVPWLHVAPRHPTRVLTLGRFAWPAAKLALRYPETVEALVVDAESLSLPRDNRIVRAPSLAALPSPRADAPINLMAIADPGRGWGDAETAKPYLAPDGLVVVAIPVITQWRIAKDSLAQIFAHVVPYREHAPGPALFLLASDLPIRRAGRPLPNNLQRITPRYLDALFLLAKDELDTLYGPAKGHHE